MQVRIMRHLRSPVKSLVRVLAFFLLTTQFVAGLPASVNAQGARSQSARPAQIDRNGVLILIRSSLMALDQANKTGNYTVLRDLASPAFQANSAARLGEIFANLRKKNVDLTGVLVLSPQLSILPQIMPNGLMRMAGVFPSAPVQVRFDLLFAPVKGQWKVFGISVGLVSSRPAAPAAAPVAVRKPPVAARPNAKRKRTTRRTRPVRRKATRKKTPKPAPASTSKPRNLGPR